MATQNPVVVEVSALQGADKPAFEALQEIKRLLVAINSTPLSNLRQQMQGLKMASITAVDAMMDALKKAPDQISKEVARAVKGTKQQMAQAGKEAGKGFVDGLEAGSSSKGFSKALRDQLQSQYDAMLRDQRVFTLESVKEWRTMGASISPEHRKMLADAAAFTGKLQAEYAKAEAVRFQANSASSRINSRSSGLFGANTAEAGFTRSNSAGTADLRGLATPATLAGVQRFVTELSGSGEAIKAAYARAHLATREGSAAMLAAMRDFYAGQENLAITHAGAKNAEVGALLGKVEAQRLFQARAEAFAAQALIEKKAAEGSAATLAAMGTAYRQEALLAHASTKNSEVGTLLGKVEAQRLFQARAESFAAQALIEKRASDGSAATLASMGTMYRQDSLLAYVSTKNAQVGTLLGKVEAQRFFQARSKAFAEQAALEKKSSEGSAATLSAMGAMYRQDEARAPRILAQSTKALTTETSAATKGQYNLADAMRSSHSAARGLASGFGAMWLTWGQIGPLLAGAAISNAAAQSVKLGMKVGQSLAVIQNLGGVAREEMEGLNKVLMETARNGPFGPVEVAKALETLALAGLSAKEQIEALKPTLDFAIAGQMSIEKASGSLIAISTAFGYQARDISVVSDIIAKTAAISMASTEGMAASFKVASVVAQQYNVSLEDVATSLALLAQIGIKDQAAGTAVRQMYSELIGTSAKARKVMKETLNFDVFDEAGKSLKPLPQILTELSAAFAKLNFASQNKALLDMGNERGTKAISAGLKAVQVDLQKAAKDYEDMGLSVEQSMTKARETTISNLEKIREEIADAPGFSALAAIGLGASTENQMKSVLASLQTALVEAFQAAEPVITRVAMQLQDMFKSEGFRTGVTNLVTGIADLTAGLAKNFDLIVVGTAAYFVARTGMTAFAGVTALLSLQAASLSATLTGAGVASGVAAAGLTGAGVAAGGASIGFGALALTLLPLTLLAATLGGAYYLLTRKVDENKQSLEDSEAVTARTIKAVETESERLRLLIEHKGDEVKAREESGRILQQTTLDEITAAGEARIAALMLASGYLELAKAKEQAYGVFDAMGNSTGAVGEPAGLSKGSARRLQELDDEIAKTRTLALEKRGETQMLFDRARERAKEAKAVAEARKKAPAAQGDGIYNGSDKPGAASGVKLQSEKSQLKNIDDAYSIIFKQTDRLEKEKQNKLRYFADIGLVSEAEFFKQSLQQSEEYGARRQELLASQEIALQAQLKLIQSARDAKKSDPANKALADAEEGAARNAIDKIKEQTEKIADDREQMRRQSRVRALKAGTNIIDNSEQELTISAANLKQELEKLDVKNNLNQLSERDQFIAGETLRILGAQQDMLVRQEATRARSVLDNGLDKLNDPNNGLSEKERQDLTAHLANLDASIAKTKAALASAGDQVREATAKAFDAKQIDDFAKHLNTSLVDALMSGGKEGGKAFREYIQNELLRKPFRMVVQALLEPITKGIATSVMGVVGGGKSLLGAGSSASKLLDGLSLDNLSSGSLFDTAGGLSSKFEKGADFLFSKGFDNLGEASLDAASTILEFKDAINIGSNALGYLGAVYDLSQGKYGSAIGGAIGTAVGGPVGAAIGSFLGGMLDGGERKNTESGVVGTLSASGLSGNSFTNWTQKGGLFGSDGSGQDLAALTDSQANGFTDNFLKLRSAATNASTALGASATVLQDYGQKIYLESGADMAAFFVKLGDNMVNVATPGVFAFAKAGETATATVNRLALALTSVNPVLAKLGQITMQISLMGADASGKLIDLFGGLENFNSSAQAFYETFYTGADKLSESQQAISRVFGSLNLTVPKTKQEFKLLTQGLNLNTEAGRTAYATLLQLAPTFATVTEELTTKSAEVADKLVKTFLGARGIVPALLASNLVVGELGTTLVSTASAAGFISTLFLDLSSGLISFGTTQAVTSTELINSQISAKKLNAQLVDLRANAEGANIDIAGLSLALRDVDLGTFQSAVGQVFENLASRISKTVSTISSERISLREAALNIIGAGPLSKADLTQGITEASALGNSGATSNSALLAARQALIVSDAAAAQQKATVNQLRALQPSTSGVDAASDKLGSANNTLASAQASVDQFRGYRNGSFDFYLNAALSGQDYRGSLPGPGTRYAGEYNAQTTGFNYLDAQSGVQQAQTAYQQELSTYNALVADNTQRVSAAQALLVQAQTQQSAALALARQAQLGYVADLQTFAVEAGRSAEKLGALREETVKYYEAQKQLADLMKNSAAGLRGTVDSFRTAQMTPEQQFANAQQKFSTAYSMALSTDGSALVGYADKLNEMLNPLLESARDIYSTEGEYNSFAATMLARAETVATRLDTLAPTNYVADSLGMLQSIDGALSLLGTATQSAEKIISDAITAGSEKTANGLRAVIAALSGQPIPAFASGGNFPGGIRLVGENGPELEVTGASKIFNATQTRDIMSGGSPSAVSAALVAEIRGLRQEVSDLRVEARATAINTGKMSRLADRADQDGMLVRTDSDTSLRTTAVI